MFKIPDQKGTPEQPPQTPRGGLGGEGTPGENTLPSGFQDPSGVLTALAVAIKSRAIACFLQKF